MRSFKSLGVLQGRVHTGVWVSLAFLLILTPFHKKLKPNQRYFKTGSTPKWKPLSKFVTKEGVCGGINELNGRCLSLHCGINDVSL